MEEGADAFKVKTCLCTHSNIHVTAASRMVSTSSLHDILYADNTLLAQKWSEMRSFRISGDDGLC